MKSVNIPKPVAINIKKIVTFLYISGIRTSRTVDTVKVSDSQSGPQWSFQLHPWSNVVAPWCGSPVSANTPTHSNSVGRIWVPSILLRETHSLTFVSSSWHFPQVWSISVECRTNSPSIKNCYTRNRQPINRGDLMVDLKHAASPLFLFLFFLCLDKQTESTCSITFLSLETLQSR